MKKFLVVVVTLMFSFLACGDSKELCFEKDTPESCQEFLPYGFIDRDDVKDSRVQYALVTGNIIWCVVLGGSIIAPLLILGFDIYEPVLIKREEIQ